MDINHSLKIANAVEMNMILGEWERGSHYAEQQRFRDWKAGLRSDTRQDRRRRSCQHFEDSKMEPNRKIGCSFHRTTAATDHSFWIGATHRRLDAAKLRREKSFQEWSTLWNHETRWLQFASLYIRIALETTLPNRLKRGNLHDTQGRIEHLVISL